MSEVAVHAENLGKRYRVATTKSASPYRTLREDIAAMPRRWFGDAAAASEDFWALRDVSFELKRGEVLGVIGRNGAGKSTLLKILSRVTSPTHGSVDLFGRVGSLLEVGTGFHPELTGRENIFLSGAILGMRRDEIRRQFDAIVAFAEVERFVDGPVKHLSSGMYARLAFSVATHLTAEIVLMDEVLAVGDAEFRRRCSDRVSAMARNDGRTVVVVSHEPALIRSLCTRALLLEGGRVEFSGAPDDALQRYHERTLREGGTITDAVARTADGFTLDAVLVGGSPGRNAVLAADQRTIDVEIRGRISFAARVALEMRLRDREGTTLGLCSPGHEEGGGEKLPPGPFVIHRRIQLPRLLRGAYGLGLYLTDPNFTGWVEIPDAVRLDVEGSTTRVGLLNAGAHCGWMLIDSTPLDERKS